VTGSRLVALAHEQLELPKGTFEALRGGDRQGPLLLYLHGFPDHPPTAAPLSRTWRAPAARIAAARDLGLIRRLWRRWSPELNLDRDRRDQLHSCLPSSLPAPIAYYRAALRPWATRRVLHELREPISTPLLQLHGADDGCVARPPADDSHRSGARHERAVILATGHFLHLEAPAEVAARVTAWARRSAHA